MFLSKLVRYIIYVKHAREVLDFTNKILMFYVSIQTGEIKYIKHAREVLDFTAKIFMFYVSCLKTGEI